MRMRRIRPACPSGYARLPILSIMAMLACLLATACNEDPAPASGGGGGGASSGPPPVNVKTTTVQELAYAPAIELIGEMRPLQQVTLASELSGRIDSITARVGDSLSAGRALVQIDDSEYRARLAIAEANLNEAELALAEARSGSRPEDIAAQQAAVQQAEAGRDDAADRLARLEQLSAGNVVSESELVTARNALRESQAALEEEQRVLDRLLAGTRQEQVDSAAARVESARRAQELAALDVERCSIAADFNASVTMLLVEVGQYVNAGSPLAELVSSEPAEAWFSLPEQQRDVIGNGTAVELRADAIPDEVFLGTVAGISAAADPSTRQFPLRVTASEARLLPGMSVRARLLLTDPAPRLLFSQDAAYDSRMGLVVYRVAPSSGEDPPGFETIPVVLGERVDGLVVLEEGNLSAGDQLVTRGKESLFEGAKLRIQQQSPPGSGEAAK
ncbi:efflux RND transporter periplasmic adaptor subunit [bacterium]|nr:efflux RND transporter periplasmic adaptor subunit [bacterium]